MSQNEMQLPLLCTEDAPLHPFLRLFSEVSCAWAAESCYGLAFSRDTIPPREVHALRFKRAAAVRLLCAVRVAQTSRV